MSHGYDDQEYDERTDLYGRRVRQRETIMDRRLRKARGEDVDDVVDDFYDDEDDEYDDFEPVGLSPSMGMPRPQYRGSGGGCAQTTLYLVLGGVITLIVLLLFFRDVVGDIRASFTGSMPSIATMMATPTVTTRMNTAAVIQRVQRLNRLETTSYTVERVIESEQTSTLPVLGNLLAGDRLLLIAHGEVVAGMDLSQLREQDVTLSADGTTVTIRLPPAQIFSTSLDTTQTRVYDRQRGWFAPDNKDLETVARQEAESEILRVACEDGILQRATDDGRRAMEQLLSLIEVDQVVIESAPVPACP